MSVNFFSSRKRGEEQQYYAGFMRICFLRPLDSLITPSFPVVEANGARDVSDHLIVHAQSAVADETASLAGG